MSTLMQASNQWATRPDDERFISLHALHNHCLNMRKHSAGKVIDSRQLRAIPVKDNPRGLQVVGPEGTAANLTHWSFGQLASRAEAPAGYMRTLSGKLAADCINYGLKEVREVEKIGVLLYRNGGGPELRAVTGPTYGRVWNSEITKSLVDRFGDGLTGQFRVPGEFKKAVAITKANTTLYASDRDMFVFLADEENRIEMPNRRDGKQGSLARGVFLWNSETGSTTFGVAFFLFDYVCCNRIVWGAEQYQEIKIRHTSKAPERWLDEVLPTIEAYAKSSTKSVTQAIESARKYKLEHVTAFMRKYFSAPQVAQIERAHLEDEQRPIETLWDAATGVTAYARTIPYQNDRVWFERQAGQLLDMAK